jgi:hypothetical protein
MGALMARRRRKRAGALSEQELLLHERGWVPTAHGLWRHPKCAYAWTASAAAQLEEEQPEPLAAREDPWRSVAGKTVDELLAESREILARPTKAKDAA